MVPNNSINTTLADSESIRKRTECPSIGAHLPNESHIRCYKFVLPVLFSDWLQPHHGGFNVVSRFVYPLKVAGAVVYSVAVYMVDFGIFWWSTKKRKSHHPMHKNKFSLMLGKDCYLDIRSSKSSADVRITHSTRTIHAANSSNSAHVADFVIRRKWFHREFFPSFHGLNISFRAIRVKT